MNDKKENLADQSVEQEETFADKIDQKQQLPLGAKAFLRNLRQVPEHEISRIL